jgi:hypothetical protein
MEDNVIYRMLPGEVWALDVTRMHSAAVLWGTRRVHLILDFADVADADLLKFAFDPATGIPAANRVSRPTLSERERDAILALSGAVDCENIKDILGLVIRKHYRKDGGDDYVWSTMRRIGTESGDPAVQAKIKDLFQHCALERDE